MNSIGGPFTETHRNTLEYLRVQALRLADRDAITAALDQIVEAELVLAEQRKQIQHLRDVLRAHGIDPYPNAIIKSDGRG